MKNLFLLLGVVAMIFSSCTQDLPGPDPNSPQDVIFTSANTGGLLKSEQDCNNPDADYAMVTIDGIIYYPATFYVGGVMYTQAIKLVPDTHTLDEFILFNDNGTPADKDDDIIVRAAPQKGSEFSSMVINPMSLNFEVFPFQKIEIPVEVLCFEKSQHGSFGFIWFRPNEIKVRQKWFFGDFCTPCYEDYIGSAYSTVPGGPQVDMPAIFKVEVYRDGVLQGTYGNEADMGTPAPLSVLYADLEGVVNHFELKVYVLVKVGTAFQYVYMGSWLFDDDDDLVTQNGVGPGTDGVYDFVVGNCNAEAADFAFGPYLNLPVSATINLGGTFAPGTLGTYIDVTISGIVSGFDISNMMYPGYCFDRNTTINVNTNYNVFVFSSLQTQSLPVFLQGLEWDRVNWVMNHLEDYPTITWSDIQQVIWKLQNGSWGGSYGGVPGISTAGLVLYNDAVLYGDGFVPLPGGWAAVTFIKTTDISLPAPSIQTVFIIVDPCAD